MSLSLRHSVVTALNGRDRSLTIATLAVDKVQFGHWITLQKRVGGVAHIAGDVCTDILLQERLELLVGIFTSDNELVLAIKRALRSKLTKHKAKNMFVVTVHTLAMINKVDPAGLCGTNTGNLGQGHGGFLNSSKLGVMCVNSIIEAFQNLQITGYSINSHQYSDGIDLQQSQHSYG